jgi:hypothetical protein
MPGFVMGMDALGRAIMPDPWMDRVTKSLAKTELKRTNEERDMLREAAAHIAKAAEQSTLSSETGEPSSE